MTTPVVVATRRWTQRACDELARQFDVRLNQEDYSLSLDEVRRRCEGATVLCPWGGDRLDAQFIASLPDSIKLIACISAGTEHVDIEAATARGILVTNTPNVVTEETADMTFALLMAAARRIVVGDKFARSSDFTQYDPSILHGTEIHGSTIGIIGMGSIGKQVAKRAHGFDMRIVYHNRKRDLEDTNYHAKYVSLETLLGNSDFVALNCPLNDSTRGLINETALKRMKSTAILINLARGGVVDHDALLNALSNGWIAAAALDVTEPEPLPKNHFLKKLNNNRKKIKDIEVVLEKKEACYKYNLPEDRMGDIICMSSEYMTIGSSANKHDLSGLNEPLRSHGGLHEREVPFIINKKMDQINKKKQLYNYDAFYYAILGAN